MKSYFRRLLVKLTNPVLREGDPMIGIHTNIGVDADTNDEAADLAKESIVDGVVDLQASEVFEADRRTVHKDILARRPPE